VKTILTIIAGFFLGTFFLAFYLLQLPYSLYLGALQGESIGAYYQSTPSQEKLLLPSELLDSSVAEAHKYEKYWEKIQI